MEILSKEEKEALIPKRKSLLDYCFDGELKHPLIDKIIELFKSREITYKEAHQVLAEIKESIEAMKQSINPETLALNCTLTKSVLHGFRIEHFSYHDIETIISEVSKKLDMMASENQI